MNPHIKRRLGINDKADITWRKSFHPSAVEEINDQARH
jgi:hypothetical protein